jgi:hypothetical protein
VVPLSLTPAPHSDSVSARTLNTTSVVVEYLAASEASLELQTYEGAESHFGPSDREHFETYLCAATLSHLLALIETLLAELVREFEIEASKSLDDETKPMPYINRYVSFLRRSCGLPVEIDKSVWKRLDVL